MFHRIHVLENNTRVELQAWARTCRRMRSVAATVFRDKMLNLGYGEPANIPWSGWLLDEADGDTFVELQPSRPPKRDGVDGPVSNEDSADWEEEEVWSEPHGLFRHGCVVRHDMYGREVDPEAESDCSITQLFNIRHLPSPGCPSTHEADDESGHLPYRAAFEFAVFPPVRTLDLSFEWNGVVSDQVQVANENGVTVWDTLETLHQA